MNLLAYIDESGRHDKTGKLQGSGQILVCGWIDWRKNWAVFNCEWAAMLEKFKVSYFHFYEWVEAKNVAVGRKKPSSSFSKNPYQGMSHEQLDDLLYGLAEIAGGGNKIYIGGFISTRDFHEGKQHPDYSKIPTQHDDPYKECLFRFFENVPKEIQQQWPCWTEPVTFVFDQNGDHEWTQAVEDACEAAKKKESRIAKVEFADKKIYPNFPLQAADMIAYRMRQLAEKVIEKTGDVLSPSRLDDLLIKPTVQKATREYNLGSMNDAASVLRLRFSDFPWRKKKWVT